LYYRASYIITLCRWPSGAPVERGQFDLLMMSKWCSKHMEEYNKLIIKKICALSWSFTKIKCVNISSKNDDAQITGARSPRRIISYGGD